MNHAKFRIVSILALAAIGVAVSLYLLTVHWGWWEAVCLGVGECEVVNTSIYSELLGIPVALLGALTYAAIIGLSVMIWRKNFEEHTRRAQFFLAITGVIFSAYLTYIELAILRTICPWCVLSAVLITLIAVLSVWEMLASSSEPAPA